MTAARLARAGRSRQLSDSVNVPILEVCNLSAGYGALAVVHDLNFAVASGEIVALLGRNGAGKTSTLLALAGYLSNVDGVVRIDGERLTGPAYKRTAQKLGIVLEGRSIFPSLTLEQNIQVAGADKDHVLHLFPELGPRLGVNAGMLSGGEQQMLALARAIARRPRALLIDELSFGLAPGVCIRLFERLREAVDREGTAVLLVEQHLHYASVVCDRALVMNDGYIRLETNASELVSRAEEIERLYLGEVVAR